MGVSPSVCLQVRTVRATPLAWQQVPLRPQHRLGEIPLLRSSAHRCTVLRQPFPLHLVLVTRPATALSRTGTAVSRRMSRTVTAPSDPPPHASTLLTAATVPSVPLQIVLTPFRPLFGVQCVHLYLLTVLTNEAVTALLIPRRVNLLVTPLCDSRVIVTPSPLLIHF